MSGNNKIDGGREFDWNKTSEDYAKYRDIYPNEFYNILLSRGLCADGRRVLDVGTGTGVLPRALHRFGADFTGIDISKNQIEQAKRLAAENGMDIDFKRASAENTGFADASFDVITACQCFFYFDHDIFAREADRMLKDGGKLAVLYMAWLPFEDRIAGMSEELILKYNPSWSGCGETRRDISIPEVYNRYFDLEDTEILDLRLPFTRESWNGRIKACRGTGASLSAEELKAFEREHLKALEDNAPEEFEILHYAAAAILRKK